MRIFLSAFLVVALMLAGGVTPARTQSLADLARREAERRKSVKDDGKVLRNEDVPNVPQPTPVPPSAAATEPKAADAAGQPAAAEPGAGAVKSATDADQPKDQKYWSERQRALQTQRDQDQTYVVAMQSRVNALTTDFVNRDDPAQRGLIETERQKAIDEIARLKVAILADTKAIADFEEEARRAGVLPGWLR